MTRALVLSGGGARGAFQVGMLEELVFQRKLDFQVLRGVSVGALNAAFLAQAPKSPKPLRELQKRVTQLRGIWESSLAASRTNVESVMKANQQILDAWTGFATNGSKKTGK